MHALSGTRHLRYSIPLLSMQASLASVPVTHQHIPSKSALPGAGNRPGSMSGPQTKLQPQSVPAARTYAAECVIPRSKCHSSSDHEHIPQTGHAHLCVPTADSHPSQPRYARLCSSAPYAKSLKEALRLDSGQLLQLLSYNQQLPAPARNAPPQQGSTTTLSQHRTEMRKQSDLLYAAYHSRFGSASQQGQPGPNAAAQLQQQQPSSTLDTNRPASATGASSAAGQRRESFSGYDDWTRSKPAMLIETSDVMFPLQLMQPLLLFPGYRQVQVEVDGTQQQKFNAVKYTMHPHDKGLQVSTCMGSRVIGKYLRGWRVFDNGTNSGSKTKSVPFLRDRTLLLLLSTRPCEKMTLEECLVRIEDGLLCCAGLWPSHSFHDLHILRLTTDTLAKNECQLCCNFVSQYLCPLG